MTSFQSERQDDDLFALDEKSEAVAHFVALVGSRLQDAFWHRKMKDGLTQRMLSDALGVDRSRIHRCLSGYSNLTLESVAELVWALDVIPHFEIELSDTEDRGCNHVRESAHHMNALRTLSTTEAKSFLKPTSTTTRPNVVEFAD